MLCCCAPLLPYFSCCDSPALRPTLSNVFEATFPYLIAGWDDSYDGRMQLGGQTFGSKEVLTTRAVRTYILRSNCWQPHHPAEGTLRRQLDVAGCGQ